MNKLKQSVKEHAFNETDILMNIRTAAHESERTTMLKTWFANKKSWVAVGVAAAMIVSVVLGVNFLPSVQNADNDSEVLQLVSEKAAEHPAAFAMVSVDINPSFEIYVDASGIVLEIKAVNDDAATLDTSSLIGLTADDAVVGIIALATEAGFINSTDTVEDYVVVSTVVLDEEDEDADEDQDALDEMIEDGLSDDGDLDDTVSVAVIKATQREMFEASGKDIPLGLYIINGMIEVDGEMIKVSEFVSNSDNVNKLKERANIVNSDDNEDTDTQEPSATPGDDGGSTDADVKDNSQNNNGNANDNENGNSNGKNSNNKNKNADANKVEPSDDLESDGDTESEA